MCVKRWDGMNWMSDGKERNGYKVESRMLVRIVRMRCQMAIKWKRMNILLCLSGCSSVGYRLKLCSVAE